MYAKKNCYALGITPRAMKSGEGGGRYRGARGTWVKGSVDVFEKKCYAPAGIAPCDEIQGGRGAGIVAREGLG